MALLSELLGESHGMTLVREKVRRLLERPSLGHRLPAILIQGETGTGKTQIARAMHQASVRRDGPFVELNSTAVPETLLEAEMFGHERGAFTDARQARPGYFQFAHGGTLFLDEVGLMSEALQGKLLKVIEEKSVWRVGGTRSESVDVWVIAASNADLQAAVRERRFREDLYHRLAVVTLPLPPLRERGDDVLLLAEHFLQRACRDHGLPPRHLDTEAKGALLAYRWPGNVRELANVMERVALFAETSIVSESLLALPRSDRAKLDSDRPAVREETRHLGRERLLEALEETSWNLSRAAARLGMPRNTLRYQLEKAGLLQKAAELSPQAPTREESLGIVTTWEPRRLALLRAELSLALSDPPLASGNWMDVVADKVQVFGGRVEERSPTGLVAVFGFERVEDAPARAAHTAMALQKAAERARADGQRIGMTLAVDVRRVQIGFSSGIATIDMGVKREAWASLDGLLALAGSDAVVVSETAAPLLKRRFELVPLDVPEGARRGAYRMIGHQQSGQSSGRRVSTFVGRHQDLELLQSRLAAAVGRQGTVVGIVGDAGIGKSRLIAEFRQSLAGDQVIYLEGAGFSYASAIPYVPVLAILRQSCGITESDSAGTITSSLRRRLETLSMSVEESTPYLLHLFGLREGIERLAELTPEAIRLRTLETLRRMILGASRQRPVLVVVEDLHWVDKASEEVLASVVADLPGAPIMVVCTYRPGFRPRWIDRSFATQIVLSPLSPEESRIVLRSLLPNEVSEPVAGMILDKAEGNPFFLEEICRAVEGYGSPGTMPAVPDTIEEVLLARIARLPEEPTRVLQSAAVLGREFPAHLLQAVWQGSGSLEAHVRLLIDLEFLHERTTGKETVYVFKHALTQQVTYVNLPPAQRRALHAGVGKALERLFAGRLEEAYDRLAYHYSNTEDATKAVTYLTGFAGKAARGDAHEEAVHALMEALQHVERLPPDVRDRRRLEIVLSLPSSLMPLGRIAEVCSILLPERDRLERLRDPALAARYYFVLARTYMLGNHALVMENARRAIAEAERCGDDTTMGAGYGVLALACALSGQAAQGIDCGRRAVALLEKTRSQWLSYAYWALGLCCSVTGAFDDAIVAEQRALTIAQAIGDHVLEGSATWGRGIIHVAQGEWDEGVAVCLRAVELARGVLYRAIATAFLGFAYVEKGDAEQAIAALEQAIPLIHRFGLRTFEGWFTAFLAEAHRLAGHLERAEMLSENARQIATEASFPVGVGWAQRSLGRVAAARGDLLVAAASLDEALVTFTSTRAPWECARTHMDVAVVAWARGDPEAARRHLERASGLFTEVGARRYRERAEHLAAIWRMTLAGVTLA